MQPPAARGAGGRGACFFGSADVVGGARFVGDEGGDHVFGLLQGMEQGGIIGKSEVPAEPN